jgi:tetratricopeptide (TPR) repeat protein
VAYGKLGKHREEAKSCRQAVKIQPDLAIAHYNLVLCYQRLGERQLEHEEERTLNLLNPSLARQLRELTTSQFTVSVDDVAAWR